MLTVFGVIILGYVLGAIPTGYWVGKAVKGIDIRQEGSGSTGATNVLRCVGKGPAAFVFFFDIFKGYLAVWVSLQCEASGLITGLPYQQLELIPMTVALLSLVGHSKSIFLGFQGGKSAATALGCAIAMNPLAAAESFGTWLLVLGVSKFVSLASMVAVVSSGFWMMLNHAAAGFTAYCMFGALYVLLRHRANITRLMAGTEPKIGQKSKSGSEPTAEQKV